MKNAPFRPVTHISTVAFRNAAEPLFHTGHVDSVLRMDAVYPGCLTSPAFFNALLYSVAHTANMGKSTPESLQLKGKALKNLNMTLSSTNPCMNHADIGAVMILQGVAVCSPTSVDDPSH